MREAWRAGGQAGSPRSLAQDQGELCSPLPLSPTRLSPWGTLQSSGCNLGQDARSLAVTTA